MTSRPTNHSAATHTLPQYGFGKDVDFDSLVKTNHFLFRVYTPKTPSPFADDTEPLFTAPKFNERFTRSPEEPTTSFFDYSADFTHVGTYSDVVHHMDWTTKSSSQYISTSFSFIWSIWEALRRYHLGVKKDVEIAVIDASAVTGRAVTAVQLLRSGLPSERRKEHWKWYRFAQESQSVLVYHCIPAEAVFASIPLLDLIEKLPSYFLHWPMAVSNSDKGSILAAVGWDYMEKKRNYRQFCQEMSNRFLQLMPEGRLQDTTTGSVRLALAFLRPWFHRHIIQDFQTATVTLCALSYSIAQWPGQWWAQEHTELWDLIQAIVLSVAEEARALDNGQNAKEITQLDVITDLEEAVESYKKEIRARVNKKPHHLLAPLLIPPPLRSVILPNSPSPLVLEPLSSHLTSRNRAIVTPLTPPTSPIRSTASRAPAFSSNDPGHTSNDETSAKDPFAVDDGFSETNPSIELPELANYRSRETVGPSHTPPIISSPELEPCASLPETSLLIVPRTLEDASDSDEPLDKSPITIGTITLFPPDASSSEIETFDHTTETRANPRKPPTIAETASCLVTGFFVGAFITLCLLSPQRRTLLLHLT